MATNSLRRYLESRGVSMTNASAPDNRSLGCRDFGGAVGGVVVIHVDIGIRQCCFEIAYHLADGDFLVVTRKKHSDGNVRIIRRVIHYIFCIGFSLIMKDKELPLLEDISAG